MGKEKRKTFNVLITIFIFHKSSVKILLKWFINNYNCGHMLTGTFYIGSCE